MDDSHSSVEPSGDECVIGADASDDDEMIFEESEEREAFLPYEERKLLPPKKKRSEEEGEGVPNLEEALIKHQDGSGLCGKYGGEIQIMCGYSGCTTSAQARGLCSKHGGGSQTVCGTTKAKARGLCVKHGGKGLCEHPGCTTKAQKRGLCCKHGGGRQTVCGYLGCTTKANVRGLCCKHGDPLDVELPHLGVTKMQIATPGMHALVASAPQNAELHLSISLALVKPRKIAMAFGAIRVTNCVLIAFASHLNQAKIFTCKTQVSIWPVMQRNVRRIPFNQTNDVSNPGTRGI